MNCRPRVDLRGRLSFFNTSIPRSIVTDYIGRQSQDLLYRVEIERCHVKELFARQQPCGAYTRIGARHVNDEHNEDYPAQSS
jgi:hypothetical protein